jgi:formiminotetrahydrofolate cyclodeaminase
VTEPKAKPGPVVRSFRDMTLDELLEAFSSTAPTPGGGAGAAIAIALSASLCAMAARLASGRIDDAPAMATEALSICSHMTPGVDEDARSYRRVIAAQRLPTGPDPEHRRRAVTEALSEASEVPMAAARAGARVAHLAARLAEEGHPSLRGDAVVAAVLAGAGAEGAGTLVRINLADRPDDDRLVELRLILDEASTWVERARRAAATAS